MKTWLLLLLSCGLLSACTQDDVPAPCFSAKTLGKDCGTPTGFFVQIDKSLPEARSGINPTTGATEYVVSTVNVPVAYQQAGKQFSCTLRRATSKELADLGPVIALCDQSWTVMYMENVSSSPCSTSN